MPAVKKKLTNKSLKEKYEIIRRVERGMANKVSKKFKYLMTPSIFRDNSMEI